MPRRSWLETLAPKEAKRARSRRGTVGGCRVTGTAGAGGFAVTYAGRHPTKGAVAIKVLSRNWATNANVTSRFEVECERLAIAAGDLVDAVPRYVDHGRHDGVPYLITELCTGGSLALRGRAVTALAPAERLGPAAWILSRAAASLSVVHARLGVVHRDVTPGNLLFRRHADGTEDVVVADFGLLKEAELQSNFSRVAGTAAYTAPEIRHLGTCDHRSDVFSLGVVAWELLTGRTAPAFGQREPLSAVSAWLPAEVTSTVEAMTAAEPGHRPELDLVVDLFRRHATAPPPPPPYPVAPLPARRRRSILAGLLLALGAGGMFGAIGSRASPAATATAYSPDRGGLVIELGPGWSPVDTHPERPALLAATDRERDLALVVRRSAARDAHHSIEVEASRLGSTADIINRSLGDDGRAMLHYQEGERQTVVHYLTRTCDTLIVQAQGPAPLPAATLSDLARISGELRLTQELTIPTTPAGEPGLRRLERNGVALTLPADYTTVDEDGYCLLTYDFEEGHRVGVLLDPDETLELAIEGYEAIWEDIGVEILDRSPARNGIPRLRITDDEARSEELFYLIEEETAVYVVHATDTHLPLSASELAAFDHMASSFELVA